MTIESVDYTNKREFVILKTYRHLRFKDLYICFNCFYKRLGLLSYNKLKQIK